LTVVRSPLSDLIVNSAMSLDSIDWKTFFSLDAALLPAFFPVPK
jgi:hypothetical protein